MKSSKVKSSKQARRLKARQDSWATISASDNQGRSGRLSFIKPGSNKK